MSTYQPKKVIPDSWANLAACPICETRGLAVYRQTGQVDQLACSNCKASFELEQDGPNIRLIVLPPDYAVFLQPAWQTWMSVYEIRRQIKTGLETHIQQDTFDKPEFTPPPQMVTRQSEPPSSYTLPEFDGEFSRDPINQEEVNLRAAGLANLGNSPREIRETLVHLNATTEQIDLALANLNLQRKKVKTNTPRNIIFVLIAVIVCLGVSALLLPLLNIPGTLKSIEPVWNYLSTTLSKSDPFGGVTGVRRVPTPEPTAAQKPLPADAQAYFDVVYSISQKPNWWEKYQALENLFPPVELISTHENVLNQYLFLAVLNAAEQNNDAKFNELCGLTRAQNTKVCDQVEDNDFAQQVQFLAEQNAMSDWWLTGPCKEFASYYQKIGVVFPFGEGRCSQP